MNLKIPFIKTNTLSMWALSMWDENVHITFRFSCFNISMYPSFWKTHSINFYRKNVNNFWLGWENINVYVPTYHCQEHLEPKKEKKYKNSLSMLDFSKFYLWIYMLSIYLKFFLGKQFLSNTISKISLRSKNLFEISDLNSTLFKVENEKEKERNQS